MRTSAEGMGALGSNPLRIRSLLLGEKVLPVGCCFCQESSRACGEDIRGDQGARGTGGRCAEQALARSALSRAHSRYVPRCYPSAGLHSQESAQERAGAHPRQGQAQP